MRVRLVLLVAGLILTACGSAGGGSPDASEATATPAGATELDSDEALCVDFASAGDDLRREFAEDVLRQYRDEIRPQTLRLLVSSIRRACEAGTDTSLAEVTATVVAGDVRFRAPSPTPRATPPATPRPTPAPTPAPTTWEDRLAAAENVPYDELFRNSDSYLFEDVYYRGEVIQVLGEPGGWNLRVNVTPGDYGFWDDTVLIEFYGDQRYLEDDIIDFVGTFTGPYTYESVMGGEITVPGILIMDDIGIRLVE